MPGRSYRRGSALLAINRDFPHFPRAAFYLLNTTNKRQGRAQTAPGTEASCLKAQQTTPSCFPVVLPHQAPPVSPGQPGSGAQPAFQPQIAACPRAALVQTQTGASGGVPPFGGRSRRGQGRGGAVGRRRGPFRPAVRGGAGPCGAVRSCRGMRSGSAPGR